MRELGSMRVLNNNTELFRSLYENFSIAFSFNFYFPYEKLFSDQKLTI